MGLLNVRLDRDLERKVKALRREGVAVSGLLRAAINQAYAREEEKHTRDRLEILDQIYLTYPGDYESLGRRYDLADRHQARAAMLESMLEKSKRRRR